MKILHVFDHSLPLHSGYTFRSQAILAEQAARGWDTCHVTSAKQGDTDVPFDCVDNLKFYRTPARKGLPWRLPVLRQWGVVEGLLERLNAVIAAEHPDILHAHSPALTGVAALRAGKRWGIPVVYECRAFWEDAAVNLGHGAEGSVRYRMSRALETHVFRNAEHVCCICEGLRNDIAKRSVRAERISVIPNAVDVDQFRFGVARDHSLADQLGLGEATVLGFIGSFYDYEGIDLAIAAMPAVLRERSDVRLLLVGGGPREAAWRAQAAAAGLGDKVLFAGRVPHHDVTRFYSLIDVMVFPRYRIRLTELVTPLKPLEAMAQGKMIVASDVGGHRELIRPRDTGMLFHAGDVDDLAATLLAVVGDPSRWDVCGRAGRSFVETDRNWRASVAGYEAVYAKARAAAAESKADSGGAYGDSSH